VRRVVGESLIPKANGSIDRVFLEPENVSAFPDAVRAILSADLMLAGPGSLYTSVLPNLLVPGILKAVRASRALKIYLCNVATQIGETEHFTVADHVEALSKHSGPGLFPLVLANDNLAPARDLPPGVEMVFPNVTPSGPAGPNTFQLVTADLVDPSCPWRHHSGRLSDAVLKVYQAQRAL
jgi:uncharacterized cofD-like protein